jgi:triosephosphate isomerase
MRKKIVAGTWKMHKKCRTNDLLNELIDKIPLK